MGKGFLLLFFVAFLLFLLSVCLFVWFFLGGGVGSMAKILSAKAREVKKLIVN